VALSKEQRQSVVATITSGLQDGSVALSEAARGRFDTEAKVKAYATGLVTNWLLKSKELNGGAVYAPKNPGIRSGSDAYRQSAALAASIEASGETVPAELAEFIAANTPAPKVKAAKKVAALDFSALPEELQMLAAFAS
jgi:hypothetical protein